MKKAGWLLLFAVPEAILHGWVLATAWNWLAVPLFRAPQLTLVAAIAIRVLAAAIIPKRLGPKEDPSTERGVDELLAISVTWAMLILLAALILKGFVDGSA